ncbi:hypothetical protein DUI87_02589 [Hirundo rustica rustica]|uniref:Retroviral nucleocapsid Gag protein p24 C-terminal domain-containing protein n=1 Tax=Hirundo rustica rustica TaxID=333673 RepID=A0A3M0LFL8_HIRRU|nr:hypothetical protein DUI87_02589 [Hirundo rustica rustica]
MEYSSENAKSVYKSKDPMMPKRSTGSEGSAQCGARSHKGLPEGSKAPHVEYMAKEAHAEHLCGDSEWVPALKQAQEIPLAVLERNKDAASKAFFSIQPDRPFQPYSKIKQLPSEPLVTFVERLTQAIDLQVKNEGAQEQVLEEMALTNANEQCKASILSLPMKPAPASDDMLQRNPSALGLLKVEEQQVPIATSIVHRRQYRTTRDAVIPIHEMICELESQEVVSKTHSPFNSPIWPVRKSDRGWRLTVDYRALNEVTPPLSAAVPDMLELQYELESKAAK